MKIPFVSDYLNYRKQKGIVSSYVDNAQELFEGAIAQTVAGNIFQVLIDEDTKLEKFEEVSIDEFYEQPIPELVEQLVKVNPNISQMQTVYSVLVAQDHKVVAESDAGQRIIDEIMMKMEEDNQPWSLAVQHMASSIILRGNILLETEFDEGREPVTLRVVDPKHYKAEMQQMNGRQKWYIGRYVDGNFKKIDSPNVRFDGINTLVGERLARSPLQTAVWPALAEDKMLKTLQSMMDVSLFSQRIIKILELKIQETFPDIGESERKSFVDSAREKIKAAGKAKPNQPIVLTDNVEVGTSDNSSSGINWVDVMSRLFDRKIFAGGNQPPIIGGSNEFVAETSGKSQVSFYSTYLQSGQEIIKTAAEWGWTRFLRSQGNADAVSYSSKSVDAATRVEENKAFQEVAKSIGLAVQAGMSLESAIDFWEFSTETTLPAELKARIIKDAEKSMPPLPNSDDDTSVSDEDTKDEEQM